MILLALGCAPRTPCTPAQDAPYSDGIPYLGIHGDPGNSDVIECSTATSFEPAWMALEGLGTTQPNTFSPDGTVVYATTSNPVAEGCRLHALDAVSGEVLWCRTEAPTVVNSAVEVDAEGRLYFTADGSLTSLSPDGETLWTFDFPDEEGAPWGLHFTPDGHVATVTSGGVVHLVDRHSGEGLASLSIPETWGYVPPASLVLDVDLSSLIPAEVLGDIEAVWGPTESSTAQEGFSTFMGAGAFCDNTLGIDGDGRLYVIGGGPDEEHGALVQVLVEGMPDAPTLRPGWSTVTNGGSATTPSIRGHRLVIGDGTTSKTLLDSEGVESHIKVVDIAACDANEDLDADPGSCAVVYQDRMQRQPMPGAPAIDDEGIVYFYEMGLDFDAEPEDRDVVALGPEGIVWEVALDEDLDWTSVITVTDEHLIGTASRIEPSGESLFAVNFPAHTEDFLLILDRSDGSLVWSHPVPDDSAATVTVGPDGALYVGVLGLISILSVDDRPELGLMRFDPR